MTCRFSSDAARREFTPVDNAFISEYLPSATGLQLQVYLYGLMQCYQPGMDGAIADALGVSQGAVAEAFCHWQAQGLVRIVSEKPLIVEYLPLQEAAAGSEIRRACGAAQHAHRPPAVRHAGTQAHL